MVSGYEPSGLTYGANDEAKLEEFIAVEGTLIRGPPTSFDRSKVVRVITVAVNTPL